MDNKIAIYRFIHAKIGAKRAYSFGDILMLLEALMEEDEIAVEPEDDQVYWH